MTNTLSKLVVIAGIALALGCGGAGGARPAAHAAVPPAETCPAGLAGLVADTEDIDGGGSLILTADAAEVDELRARVHRFVELAESGADGEGEASWLRRSSLAAVDVPEGVRLDARPRNEGRARELRRELIQIAIDLEAGRCPTALTFGS